MPSREISNSPVEKCSSLLDSPVDSFAVLRGPAELIIENFEEIFHSKFFYWV